MGQESLKKKISREAHSGRWALPRHLTSTGSQRQMQGIRRTHRKRGRPDRTSPASKTGPAPDQISLTKKRQHTESKQTGDGQPARPCVELSAAQINPTVKHLLSPSPTRWLAEPPLAGGGRRPGAVSCLCPQGTGVTPGVRWMENIPSSLFRRALSRKQCVGIADNTEYLLCGRHVSQGLHQCRHSVLETTL